MKIFFVFLCSCLLLITFGGCELKEDKFDSNISDFNYEESVDENNKDASNNINKVRYVSIKDKNYYSYYLYHCTNAVRLDNSIGNPTILSDKEQHIFDELKNEISFCVDNNYAETGDKISAFLTDCYVHSEFEHVEPCNDKIELTVIDRDEYSVSIQDNGDTYIITYYTLSFNYGIGTNPESYIYRKYANINLNKNQIEGLLEKHTIETVKSNVIIYYETQA